MPKYKIQAVTCIFVTDMSNLALVKEFRSTNAIIVAPEDFGLAKINLLNNLETVKKIIKTMEVSL